MPRARLLAFLGALVILAGGWALWPHLAKDQPKPVTVATAPIPAPTSSGLCSSPIAAEPPESTRVGLVWLDQDPIGATLVWAVTDQTHGASCRVVTTQVGPTDAQRLAKDLDAGRVVPKDATFSCPMDDGSWMAIYAQTPRGTQVAVVPLTGCVFISAPGRQARFSTDQLRADLARLAPAFAKARLTG